MFASLIDEICRCRTVIAQQVRYIEMCCFEIELV